MQKPLSPLVREVVISVSELMRSEIKLAQAEMTQNLKAAIHQLEVTAIIAGLSFFGAASLVTAMIIGVGRLLGNQFGISALITGGVLLVPGMIFLASRKNRNPLGAEEVQSPFRASLHQDQVLVQERIKDLEYQIKVAS